MDAPTEIAKDVLTDLAQTFDITKSDELEKKMNRMLKQDADTYLLYKMFDYPMYLLPYIY